MANLTWALVVVLCVDLILFLGQAAITDINPMNATFTGSATHSLFDCSNTTLSQQGDCQALTLSQNPKDSLPGGTISIEPTTGNIFTDIFTSIRSFIVDKTGLGNVLKVINAPGYWLANMGAPAAFTWAVSALWYGVTFFLLVSFIWGRQGE